MMREDKTDNNRKMKAYILGWCKSSRRCR